MTTTSIMQVAAACARRPWIVIAAAAPLCAGAFAYTASHIAIDTDSTKLIAEEVDWRKRELAFDAAFPQRTDLIAVVVDAATPELAEETTARLTQRLMDLPELFQTAWRPDGGPFFDRAGLLFQSADEVAETTRTLIAAQPMLGMLAPDPTVRGLLDALSRIVEGAQDDQSRFGELAQPLTQLADAFEAIVAGQTPALSWHTLITGRAPAPRELRRFILVRPVLDYSVVQPGERAERAIRLQPGSMPSSRPSIAACPSWA